MSQLDIYNIPYKAIIGVKFNELLITCSSFITFVFEVIEDLLHEFFYLYDWVLLCCLIFLLGTHENILKYLCWE